MLMASTVWWKVVEEKTAVRKGSVLQGNNKNKSETICILVKSISECPRLPFLFYVLLLLLVKNIAIQQ